MADEATVRSYLRIRIGNVDLPPYDSAFTADVSTTGGPTPGTITVTEDGTDIDLSQLTFPGLAFIKNLSETSFVDLGVWNPDQAEFYPILRYLPTEGYVCRLHPLINMEWAGTGTGTTGQLNTFRLKAEGGKGSIKVLVAAHET